VVTQHWKYCYLSMDRTFIIKIIWLSNKGWNMLFNSHKNYWLVDTHMVFFFLSLYNSPAEYFSSSYWLSLLFKLLVLLAYIKINWLIWGCGTERLKKGSKWLLLERLWFSNLWKKYRGGEVRERRERKRKKRIVICAGA
jgi:hypothetical protein